MYLSRLNEDSTLDWDVTVEEIQCMIKRLKRGKSTGPDGMVAEHVIYGGSDCGYITFLVVSLDMKLYHKHKGKGRDLLQRGSYRRITVTPVIAKLF